MNEQEVLEKVIEIFSAMTEKERISPEDELIEDLELSSIDIFTLLAELEKAFHVLIPERKIREMETIEDVKNVILELL